MRFVWNIALSFLKTVIASSVLGVNMTMEINSVTVKVDRQHNFLFADVGGVFEDRTWRGKVLCVCDLNVFVPVMSADEGCNSIQFSVLEDLDIQEFDRGAFFILDIIDIDFLFSRMFHVSVPLAIPSL